MSNYWLPTVFVLLMSLAFSCSKQGDSCPSNPAPILAQGLDFVKVGQPLSSLDFPTEAKVTLDTLYHQAGYYWRAVNLKFKGGEVVVEGDFIDEREFTEEKIAASKVNRIRIETSCFRTESGLQPGSSFKDLREAFPDEAFYFDPIPDFGVLQVQVGIQRIFYLLQEEEPYLSTGQVDNITPEMIPEGTTISSLVLM